MAKIEKMCQKGAFLLVPDFGYPRSAPCTLHPDLFPAQKARRSGACEAKENIKRKLQQLFQEELGLRCFFPEPSGGSPNTGNVATSMD